MNNLNKKNQFDQEDEKKIDKNRRAVARAGAITPLMMTLISKTALGQSYHCTVSGMQSGNLSSHPDEPVTCEEVGFSATNWKSNAEMTSGDGNINHWLINAGVIPFSIRIRSDEIDTENAVEDGRENTTEDVIENVKEIQKPSEIPDWLENIEIYDLIFAIAGEDAEATLFADIFGSGTGTLWENLANDTLESDAATAYLNAKQNQITSEFNPIYENVSPEDIVNFYVLAKDGSSGFTTSSGTEIDATFNAGFYLATITD